MGAPNKKLAWRVIYVICSLVYMAWVVYLSQFNFGLVHRDYRRADNKLQPETIEAVALQELFDRCIKELGREESACQSWPAEVVADQQKIVLEMFENERSRMVRKLVLFYIYFGVIFLILPPLILYMTITILIRIYKSIKFVK